MISELKLLKGSPIYVGNIPVYPLTIGEITDSLGEEEYFKYLSAVTVNKERVGLIDEEITNFELVCTFCFKEIPFGENGENFKDIFLSAMKIFLREDIEFVFAENYMFFIVGDIKEEKIISIDNFDQIVDIIKYQNCMIKATEEDQYNPADQKAKEILEKQKRARELLAKAKKKDDSEPLTLADLVSILVANGNGITPFNVWDMNFYMFNNQFNRMQMLEEYDINIRSLLAGAKSDDIKLKHWMSKMK